jgi:hypothetical protein
MNRHLFAALALLALLAPALLPASTMKQTGVFIDPLPENGAVVNFDDLAYGDESTRREIASVRVEIESDEATGEVLAVWTFTGNNANGNLQRIDLSLFLLDESGRQIAFSSKKMVLRRGVRGQTKALELRLSRDDWKAAKRAKIEANFGTL